MTKLPIGWFDLVHDLRFEIADQFPSTVVSEMTSDRGWLHVRYEDAHLTPVLRQGLDRLIQRFVTQSLSTCMSCGSSQGRDRPERREVTCDECETVSAMDEYPRIKLDDLRDDFPDVFDVARYVDVGLGWLPLVREFVTTSLTYDPSLTVYEVKQKFGGMRIWCDTPILEAHLAQGKAGFKSTRTCEICGNPGFLRRPPPGKWAWWRTLCDEHASPDQMSWGNTYTGPYYGHMQVGGDWYRYDAEKDAMVPSEPPARWR